MGTPSSARGWHPSSWPARIILRYIAVLFLGLFVLTNYALWRNDALGLRRNPGLSFRPDHPIRKLMIEAKIRHEATLEKRTFNVESAAAQYRERRGRHPPPGFDAWFSAAHENDSVVVEDYFDRIYKDLQPFWALDASELAQRASTSPFVVKVRDGVAEGVGDTEGRVPWLQLWTELVAEFAQHLPDVDMPINMMDESRLLVPYDKIDQYVEIETRNRVMPDEAEVTTTFSNRTALDLEAPEPYDPEWIHGGLSYWDLAVQTCRPDTPAYGVGQIPESDYEKPIRLPADFDPEYTWNGYVKNWTAAMDPCLQPHVRQLHGTFIAPISMSSTQELIPLFGGSKLPMNNEILIPGAMYLTTGEFYSGGEDHGSGWSQKKDGIMWRGTASGGHFRSDTWHHYQRHRLVEMLNSSVVAEAESTGGGAARAFELPDPSLYKLGRLRHRPLSSWLSKFADAGFTYICGDGCDFMDPFFSLVDKKPMKEQYAYKFLPDADGNSFSARFRGFMRSTSLPLKATIYAEWHDDRLVPWVHFVPMDNTFRDLLPILEFLSDKTTEGDKLAAMMAENGRAWSERVLRREDMKLYVWRLLLEWARVSDPNRDTLGYVG